MKIHVSELSGMALNYLVAQCKKEPVVFSRGGVRFSPGQFSEEEAYSPSSNWMQGGPIIEHECTSVNYIKKRRRTARFAS